MRVGAMCLDWQVMRAREHALGDITPKGGQMGGQSDFGARSAVSAPSPIQRKPLAGQVVPEVGLEPTLPRGNRILNPETTFA